MHAAAESKLRAVKRFHVFARNFCASMVVWAMPNLASLACILPINEGCHSSLIRSQSYGIGQGHLLSINR